MPRLTTASLLPSLLLLLASSLTPTTAQTPNAGAILVLNTTDSAGATAADAIGCLDAGGEFVATGCATFYLDTYFAYESERDWHMYTTAAVAEDGSGVSVGGNCTMFDSAAPADPVDGGELGSVYGRYALTCVPGWEYTNEYDFFWTLTGLSYPIIGYTFNDVAWLWTTAASVPPVGTSQPIWPLFEPAADQWEFVLMFNSTIS